MRRLIMACITGYQRFISPFIPAHCRFTPTCSEYMLTAIQHHGTCRGLWLGLKRLSRCHPFGSHGYDPVPEPDTHVTNKKEPSVTAGQCRGSHNNPGDIDG
jgi:putative membrane protein insertion efficiency factor